jgi:hypothetical protein
VAGAEAFHALDDADLARPTKVGAWQGREATEWRSHCDPKTIVAIDLAFDGAWDVLETRDLLARFANGCELQAELVSAWQFLPRTA